MRREKIANILLVVMAIMILLGVALSAYFISIRNDRDVIRVSIEDGKSKTITFEHLQFVPGESCDYAIELSSKITKKYDLFLDFMDLSKNQTLKDYAYVRIEMEGQVICDKLLSTVLEENAIHLAVDFTGGSCQDVTISYYLPQEVGNEIQGAEAIFELRITAGNQ